MNTLPTTAYDRAALMGGALAGGDVDAATAAIFAPMELSPQELKTLKDKFAGSHADNPIIKTALSLAENPIIWIGAAMALGPWGRVMDIRDMHALMSEGRGFMREVSPLMRGLVSPITALRDLWPTGWLDKTFGVVQRTSSFFKEMLPRFDDLKRGAEQRLGRKITDREWVMIHAHNEGWDTLESPVLRDWKVKYPDIAKTPLIPNLRAHMDPEVLKLAEAIKERIWKAAEPYYGSMRVEAYNETLGLMEQKGIEMIPRGYVHRVAARDNLDYLLGGKQMARRGYEKMLRAEPRLPKMVAQRKRAASMPNLTDLKLVEDIVDPRQLAILKNIPNDGFKEFYQKFYDTIGALRTQLAKAQAGQIVAENGRPYTEAEIETLTKSQFVAFLRDVYGESSDLSQAVGNQLFALMRRGDAKQLDTFVTLMARRLGSPAMYSLNPRVSVPKYLRALGPLWAWFGEVPGAAKPLGAQLNEIFSEGAGLARAWQRDLYTDIIRPSLRGLRTPKEYARGMWFNGVTQQAREWLDSDSQLVQRMPGAVKDWMRKSLDAGALSEKTIGGRISSLLYVSALGANLSPVSKNLFQNWITTANFVGVPNVARGTKIVAAGLAKLSKRMAGGEKFEEAFADIFPDYYKQFGHEHMLKSLTEGDVIHEASGLAQSLTGNWNKAKAAMMGPFAGSEKFNRLLAFYSAHSAGLESGLNAEQAGVISRNITLMTQFGGGAIGIPNAIRELPVPFRQFGQFPLRMLEWLYGSARMGPDANKLSLGIMGRTMVGSAGIYEIFKNLVGLDVSSALAFSALPNPTFENAPFYPWPIVPPAVSVAGDIAKGMASGKWEGVGGRTLAMLTPGGLGIRRLYKTFAPKYIDYNARQADGSYPVYNQQGYLVRNEQPMSIIMRGLGLQPAGVQEEMALTQWLMRQRDKIRGYRREYIAAILDNNLNRADSIQKEFGKAYPQLGPIQVKKRDLEYANGQRQITRIQRILKGMPASYRTVFEDVAGLAMANDFAGSINTQAQSGSPGL